MLPVAQARLNPAREARPAGTKTSWRVRAWVYGQPTLELVIENDVSAHRSKPLTE
jgi:hypothetical protein